MKAVIQRVNKASVSVNGQVVSQIEKGLCVLIGITTTDGSNDLNYICRKILNIRLFEDNGKRWMKSVMDIKGEILCISQFTLYHKLKGNKPDFHLAMQGNDAKKMYQDLLDKLKNDYDKTKIKDGIFGEYMQVDIQNDGPVTVEIESDSKSKTANESTAEIRD